MKVYICQQMWIMPYGRALGESAHFFVLCVYAMHSPTYMSNLGEEEIIRYAIY